MANGTLANLAHSAFVRTPPKLSTFIVQNLLIFPTACTILDPTAGEGDLLQPALQIPGAHLFGIEISAERAAVARQALDTRNTGHSQIVTSAFEAVHIPAASFSLILCNPPYLLTNSKKRAEYTIVSAAGEALVPSGIMVAIIPARSAWDGLMINHWCRWYEDIRIWKFPDRVTPEDESVFEDFSQICVVGMRRIEPVEIDPALREQLQQARFRTRKKGRAGERIEETWDGGTPPPDLPGTPLPDPYQVPLMRLLPTLVVRNADEAQLLTALKEAGAHLSGEWEAATSWTEEQRQIDPPTMPYTGAAHVAAEVLSDVIGGEVIYGPELGPEARPYLFTAFVSSEWCAMHIGQEDREKLSGQSLVSVSLRQYQDLPVLGVLELETGQSHYYEGESVFSFLAPWMGRLASAAASHRPARYQLDPADWELSVLTQFALDKHLQGAAFPGLAPAQMHRVAAMGRSLDQTGRTAIQGEPGVGKTRIGVATAARQAYRWQHRQDFRGESQPCWITDLRRAWLKNPTTRAMLGLEPVYGQRLPNGPAGEVRMEEEPTSTQLIAYRQLATGQILLPEEAGPTALPVLVTTPKKVTKEYANEIKAAWPEAEVLLLESHRDIPRWMQRCVETNAPAVVAIFSHSTTRAFGRVWQPAIREQAEQRTATGRSLRLHRFHCPDCFGTFSAVPGNQVAAERKAQEEHLRTEMRGLLNAVKEQEEEKNKEPVTSHFWFEQKQRWCQCQHRRNQERSTRGRCSLRTPCWTDARLASTIAKYPPLSFAAWSAALDDWREQARQEAGSLLATDLLRRVEADPALLVRIVALALGDSAMTSRLADMLGETSVSELSAEAVLQAAQQERSVRAWLVEATRAQFPWEAVCLGSLWERAHDSRAVVVKRGQEVRQAERGTRLVASLGGSFTDKQGRSYGFGQPPADSFSPYDYLYRFFRGCVALSIVDESHNGRGASTDIAHAHHQAMLASQTHALTSGTHFGGDILSFYHYWYRFHPRFWKQFGLGWHDAPKALKLFGVVQEWTKEYESEARRGSRGSTDVQVSTIPAPGISTKLIPHLLTDLAYLTVLDVGAFMPPRIEIPELVPMEDPVVKAAWQEADQLRGEARILLESLAKEKKALVQLLERGLAEREELQTLAVREREAQTRSTAMREQADERSAWARERDLLLAHKTLVGRLNSLAEDGNPVARTAKGTIPRWFASLPCDTPFELWQTHRSQWGEEIGRTQLVETPSLSWEYRYPMEVRLCEIVQKELAEGRRVMLYIEQNEQRSMPKRLTWVLDDIPTWVLPNSTKAEDRQQAILDAVKAGNRVVIVPYRRVNEGLNLQSAIDTIIWCEMAMNLFLLDQASRRAWRLGKREEVRIYYLAYAGTAAHTKLRKLGSQSGAAAAFAGEVARGALIEQAGADKTVLARLSSFIEAQQGEEGDVGNVGEEENGEQMEKLTFSQEEAEQLKEAFARRAAEERETLKRGRQWFGGVVDTLAERLPAFFTEERQRVSVWASPPDPRRVSLTSAKDAPTWEAMRVIERVLLSETTGEATSALLPTPQLQTADQTGSARSELVTPATLEAIPSVSVEVDLSPSLVMPTAQKDLQPTTRDPVARLIFGHEEHIQLARPKRARKARKLGAPTPRRKDPVEVQTIPAVSALPAEAVPQITLLTLWDWLSADATTSTPMPSVKTPTLVQPLLWGD
ncbi:MAG: DUF6094 domain-containing protein [Ktedonobacteraceae bacterium]